VFSAVFEIWIQVHLSPSAANTRSFTQVVAELRIFFFDVKIPCLGQHPGTGAIREANVFNKPTEKEKMDKIHARSEKKEL